MVKPAGLRLGIAWLPDHKQSLCGQPYWAREGGGKISYNGQKCKLQNLTRMRPVSDTTGTFVAKVLARELSTLCAITGSTEGKFKAG